MVALVRRADGVAALLQQWSTAPGQDPANEYAAVVPRFVMACLNGTAPEVHGDGEQSRDFTYIDDVVEANLLAGRAPEEARGRVLNVGGGREPTSVNRILEIVAGLTGATPEPEHTPPREGDVLRTEADVSLARRLIGYEPRSTSTRACAAPWSGSARRSAGRRSLPGLLVGARTRGLLRCRVGGVSVVPVDAHELAGQLVFQQADVTVDHQRDELLEAGPRLPTEGFPCLGRISAERGDLRRTEVPRIDLDMPLPVEPDPLERQLHELRTV